MVVPIPWGAVISGGLQAATTGTLGALNYNLGKSALKDKKKVTRVRLQMEVDSHSKAMESANLTIAKLGEEIERALRIGREQENVILKGISMQYGAMNRGDVEAAEKWQRVTRGAITTGALDVDMAQQAEAEAKVKSASPWWGPFSGVNPALLIGGALAGIYILRR